MLVIPSSRPTLTFLLAAIVAMLIPGPLRAGTLDDAPFHIVVPDGGWQVADTAEHAVGKDVSVAATVSNTNGLRSVVIKAVLQNASDSSLDDLCAGIRDSFANPAVYKISEGDTKFLGYKAKTFAYQISQGDTATYNEATIFIADGKGWTITSLGPAEKKEEVKKIIKFFKKKER